MVMHSKVCQSTCNLSTKLLKDLSQNPLVQYPNLIKHYVGTIFVHASLGVGIGLSTKPAYQK